jgi:hypothetical protein
MEAALENEKRDRLLENEKRDRESEKKDLEQKMVVALENERRDRLLEEERRVRQAEKKDVEMMAALEKNEREHWHQIEQLKSEARISQMEQQLLAYTSQSITIRQPIIQHTAAVDPIPQGERELKLKAAAPAVQPASTPNEDTTSPLQAPDTSRQTALQPAQQQLEPKTSPAVSQASTISILHQQHASQIASQQPRNEPSAASSTLSKNTHQQHKVGTALPQGAGEATGGAVPLPGGSHTHFFLSHCQSSGGDQTNAIYLELRQLGFTCWYDNRADDLTKEGMRKGIVHAAAFLLFLSKGVLDRPFCEYLQQATYSYVSFFSEFDFTAFLTAFPRPI